MNTKKFPILAFPERQEEGDVLTIERPDEPGSGGSNYRVILYNDDFHPVDQVIEQVMKATECDLERAVQITLEAHRKGRAVCFRGNRSKCQKVTKVLREIRLQCEVDCD
ncbi:ATP-dependent Clp protease adapter protein ClpS [Abditibacteriota bacterium]|nr:ATP-dependent Clp protease adapter protein ClpS [Abditibacteriota bacterium]